MRRDAHALWVAAPSTPALVPLSMTSPASQARGLLLMMQFIGVMSQGGATIPQVALNWLMAKGAPLSQLFSTPP